MQRSFDALDPKTYSAPSGEYTLTVNPDDSQGRGGARYCLSRKGAVVWEGARPFTLREACVTDAGVIGGYGYSAGPAGWRLEGVADGGGYGVFEIVILDARGRPRLHRKVKRASSRFLHTPPQPLAAGAFLDGMQERLIVRIADADLNRGAEEWWVYQLSTGRELRRLTPKVGMGSFEAAQFVIDARGVAGTPLVLLHWWRFESKPDSLGAHFTLIDLEQGSAKPVWGLDLPRDYSIPKNEAAQDRLMDEIRKSGAILAATTPRQFTLRFVAQKQRVTFHAVPERGGRWRVTKAQSIAYATPPTAPPAKGEAVPPTINLTLRDRLDLLTTSSGPPQTPHPIRSAFSLVPAEPGQFAFVRYGKKPALLVVTQQGEVLHEVDLDRLRGPQQSARDTLKLNLVWQGGTRFIVFRERPAADYRNSYTEAYRVDVLSGAVNALAGFRCPSLTAVAAFSGGGFVVLVTTYAKYTMKEDVYAYDGDGKRLWALPSDFGVGPNDGPEKLLNPESLAVLRDGTVAVLNTIYNSVQFYDRNGRYLRTLSLEAAWKREPEYPSDIIADPDGGFLVHDFSGTPTMVWMKGDDSVIRSFTPRYANGLPISSFNFCITADGRLWVSDTYSIFGLDTAGRATTRLGAAPDANHLGDITDVALQEGGRILVVDGRTGAIYVLDRNGRRLHICLPRGGAAEAPSDEVANEKEIILGPNDTFARNGDWFGADGKLRNKPAGFVSTQERASRLRRRPNGTWLGRIRERAAASNGALAILDELHERGYSEVLFLNLYSAKNAPERTIAVPHLLGRSATLAYDGKRVVLVGGGWAYCYAATGQPLWRFALPLAPGEPPRKADEWFWSPFLTDGGRTLCLYDGDQFLYRYAMR